jgi:hypothetical protein
MVVTKKSLHRRAFLCGTGAGLALPLLDAMTPAFAVDKVRPLRMGFVAVPNGIMNLNNEFAPKATGALEMTPTLQPLADFKDRMLVFSGLDSQQAAGLNFEVAGDHPRACTAWLTGSHAKMTSGADLKAGVSVDQIAAQEFGKYTQLASLEVGLESADVVGACESSYSCAYYNTISWRNETTPMPMENRPRAIFERLFGAAGTTDPKTRLILRQEDRSILDAINQDVKRLRGKLGGPDRGKIDQYLEAVRDVERRIQLAESQSKDKDIPALVGPAGTPTVFSEYFRLMADLMVLAWQTDMTRVVTFQIGHEMSGRAYPEIGFGDSHHSVTHHHGDPEKIAKTTRINMFHTKMLAYYLDKLRQTPDGDGSLLDHSMILYGAALSDANLHLYTDLPLLLVAGGVNGIKGGRHLRYPQRTPMSNLLLTMLDKANVPNVSKLGDSTGKLDLSLSV